MPPFPREVIHQIYARYRFRNYFTMEKAGRITYEFDPQTGLILQSKQIIKLMPVGGFDGFLHGLPLDAAAPPRPQQKRPAQAPADPEAIEDEALYNHLYALNPSEKP
jgi:hypothetical protein